MSIPDGVPYRLTRIGDRTGSRLTVTVFGCQRCWSHHGYRRALFSDPATRTLSSITPQSLLRF